MTLDQLLALSLYAFVMSITPGPNNTMLLASGVNFGFKQTLPHWLGVNLGFSVMILAVGAGIGALFEAVPALHLVLRYGGALYLLYLAWRIATSGAPRTDNGRKQPMSFLQAASFQWVNPKGWMSAIGTVATYTPANGFFVNLLTVTILFVLIMSACTSVWTGLGSALRGFLTNPGVLRVFNIAMALLLVASLYPIVTGAM